MDSSDAPSRDASADVAGLADRCPACDADFDAGPIPEEHRQHYSPPYRFSRRIGIVWGDRVQVWRCPDCSHEWPRQ